MALGSQTPGTYTNMNGRQDPTNGTLPQLILDGRLSHAASQVITLTVLFQPYTAMCQRLNILEFAQCNSRQNYGNFLVEQVEWMEMSKIDVYETAQKHEITPFTTIHYTPMKEWE